MAKLSAIAKGYRARKPVAFTLLDGTEVSCALRPLDGNDHAALIDAATRSLPAGIKAVDGEPVYEFAKAVETIARGFVDPESPEDKPEPFFDGGAEQVRAHLDRDRIFWLAEQQRAFQSEISPMQSALTADEFFAAIVQIADAEEKDALPFETWQPALRRSFLRTTARLLLASQSDKSASGGTDEAEAIAS